MNWRGTAPGKDDRSQDHGRESRRPDLKVTIMVLALLINAGVIVWKGGQISGKFDAMMDKVGEMNGQIQVVLREQSATDRTLSVQQERINQVGERLSNHEGRITRIEERWR